MRNAVIFAMLAALCSTSARADDLADRKTRSDIAKNNADALTPLGALSGSTADAKDSDKTAHGLALRYAVYRGVVHKVVNAIGCKTGMQPIVVFGTTPPSVAQWLSFQSARDGVQANLGTARSEWEALHVHQAGGGLTLFIAGPVAIKAVSDLVSLAADTSSYSGASIKAPDTQLTSEFRMALVTAGCSLEAAAFQIEQSDFVKDQLKDTEYQAALLDYKAYKAFLANPGPVTAADKELITKAATNLATAIADYETLRKNLYTEANGRSTASVIAEEKRLFETSAHRDLFPVLYVTDQDAALTTRTRKGFATLFHTPIELTSLATISYAIVKAAWDGKSEPAQPLLGTASCAIAPRRFADALGYEPETGKVGPQRRTVTCVVTKTDGSTTATDAYAVPQRTGFTTE